MEEIDWDSAGRSFSRLIRARRDDFRRLCDGANYDDMNACYEHGFDSPCPVGLLKQVLNNVDAFLCEQKGGC